MSEDASAQSARAAQTAIPAASRRHQPIPSRPELNQSRSYQSESILLIYDLTVIILLLH